MIQNIQVHMMSHRCRFWQHILSSNKLYIDELFKTGKMYPLKKKQQNEKENI